MNNKFAILENADAYLIVVDRDAARQLAPGCAMRAVLHETQLPIFDSWLRDESGASILAFGRVFRRQPDGERVLDGLPMAFAKDVRAFDEFLRIYHETTCRDVLRRNTATAFLVMVADEAKAKALRDIIRNLQAGG